jgi:uncharacterized membrane protein YcaP (DUF421 family)
VESACIEANGEISVVKKDRDDAGSGGVAAKSLT